MELSSPKLKTIQEGTFRAQKIIKKHSKIWNFLSQSLKNLYSYISGENLQSPENKNFLYFGKWNFLAPNLSYIFLKKVSTSNFRHPNFFHHCFLYQNLLYQNNICQKFLSSIINIDVFFSLATFLHSSKNT